MSAAQWEQPRRASHAWVGYRNHAQRVFVFASQLVEPRADAAEQLAIAAAFHDIAVFRTVDYLVPNGWRTVAGQRLSVAQKRVVVVGWSVDRGVVSGTAS